MADEDKEKAAKVAAAKKKVCNPQFTERIAVTSRSLVALLLLRLLPRVSLRLMMMLGI